MLPPSLHFWNVLARYLGLFFPMSQLCYYSLLLCFLSFSVQSDAPMLVVAHCSHNVISEYYVVQLSCIGLLGIVEKLDHVVGVD